MSAQEMPETSKDLFNRIRLVRRDVSDLLFHFTRNPGKDFIAWKSALGGEATVPGSTFAVLNKILAEGKLKATSTWTPGYDCVCFTEAPITEFNAIFSLVAIAASKEERPRYEPYGIAVSKKWLYKQGGRPVIYDHPEVYDTLPENMKYRFVPYDPENATDYTWEREWRIRTDALSLDPNNTLVIVPSADEAFKIVYDFAEMEADVDIEDGEPYMWGAYHVPRWLAVSLDIFGLTYLNKQE